MFITKNLIELSRFQRLFSTAETLKPLPLHDLHKAAGAKWCEFAGYNMPINYSEGLIKEHNQCRKATTIFDVTHMGQTRFYGKDRFEFIESLTTIDF
jgi:aminomethyltransferase